MPTPTQHFLGNHTSAPRQIVQWCKTQWPDQLPPGLLFCVPTALAMRRLRDELVREYVAFHGVRFTQPAGLTAYFQQPDLPEAATDAERFCVWDRVFDWLAEADEDNLVAQWLFPGDKAWLARPTARYTVAKRLTSLRATLAEACLDFGAVATHPQTRTLSSREQARWAALDLLETRFREQLAALNLSDPTDIQLAILRQPVAAPIESQKDWHLVVACVPDMMPALTRLFQAAPRCDILIQTSATDACAFTEHGTPNPKFWNQARLALPDSAIELAETPVDEAICVERFLARHGSINPGKVCLGILNHEVMPQLSGAFESHGMNIFEPDPIHLSAQPATRFLRDLFRLVANDRIEFVLPLLTIPETATLVNSDYATLRMAFVELIDTHRPATFRKLHTFLTPDTPEAAFANRLQAWVNMLREMPCEGARQVLIELFGTRFVDPVKDALLFSTFEALQEIFTEIEEIRVPDAKRSAALLMACINQTTLHPVRGSADCSYEGRFELLWSNAESFAIAGLNEGIFPDTAFEDAFLPNAFRKALGLRSDVTRIARDAYILDTLCKRCPPENLKLTCSRLNANSDWIKPSRLFFRCDPEQLRHRAEQFFLQSGFHQQPHGSLSGLAFKTPPHQWMRKPQRPQKLSASAIRTFLISPFLYALQYELRLSDTTPLEDGVQQNVFGTLIHTALEALTTTDSRDPEHLITLLHTAFDKTFTHRYGTDPDVEQLALRHAALKRLKAAAMLEAQLREEGWQTYYTEDDTRGKAWEVPLDIHGTTLTLYGKIDRVDYHPGLKRWRVIDYKTGANALRAREDHWKRTRKSGDITWFNFQLPIYRLLIRHAHAIPAEESIETAYFALPPIGNAMLSTFEDPVDESDTLQALKNVIADLLTLSPETCYRNAETLQDPLLKHLLSSYLTTDESHD